LTAASFGKKDAQEVRDLQATLERLEQRDRPPGGGEPEVKIATGVASLYLQERRAGRSHAEARASTSHSFGYRGVDLDRQLDRPQRVYEREREATTPRPEAPLMGARA